MTHTWSLHTWPPFINFSSSCMIGWWWCLTGCRPKSRRCSTVRGIVSPSPLFHFSVHYGQLRNDRRHTGVHPPTFHWSEATASDRWRRGDWRTVHFKGISALFWHGWIKLVMKEWKTCKHFNYVLFWILQIFLTDTFLYSKSNFKKVSVWGLGVTAWTKICTMPE